MYAACGCVRAILDSFWIHSIHSSTFSRTYSCLYSSEPITAPRCLRPSSVMLMPVPLKVSLAASKYSFFTVSQDFDALGEFDTLSEQLENYELDIITKLYDAVGVWEADQLITLFENSLKVAWINHIEAKYPILKSVSTPKLQLLEDRLQED